MAQARKYLLAAMTSPVAGREAEYNEWYDGMAIPAYRSIPGLTPLGRFEHAGFPPSFDFEMPTQWQYLSLYLIETDDFAAFAAQAKKVLESHPSYFFSDAIDKQRFFEPVFAARGELNLEPVNRYLSEKRKA